MLACESDSSHVPRSASSLSYLAVEKSMDLLNYSETGASRAFCVISTAAPTTYSALHGCIETERALGDMLGNSTCALSDGICSAPIFKGHLYYQYGCLFGVPCITSSGGSFWTTKNCPNKSSANVRAEIGVAQQTLISTTYLTKSCAYRRLEIRHKFRWDALGQKVGLCAPRRWIER